jgi:hypothetical protein
MTTIPGCTSGACEMSNSSAQSAPERITSFAVRLPVTETLPERTASYAVRLPVTETLPTNIPAVPVSPHVP